jgi:multidrug efflux pump subunit AcrB
MQIAEFSVKRYQFTIVIFLMLVAIGITALLTTPRAEDPSFPNSNFTVVAIYPGANPSDVERQVVKPIEDKLNELEDIKHINTTVEDGLAVVAIEFFAESDADKKYDDVLRQVNSIRGDLPQGLQSLDVAKFSTTNVSILQVALVSETAPYAELEDQADKMKKRFETVAGVKDSKKWAYPNQQVRIALDVERMAQLNIPLNQVINSVQSNNASIPAGSVAVGNRTLNIETNGNFKSMDDVRNTVVSAYGGNVVYLKDIAQVSWNYEDETYTGRYNGKRAVFVTATMKDKQNIFTVRNGLYKELETFEKKLPASIKLERGFDQSQNVAHRLGGLSRDFVIAILLVLLTLLPLGVRASVIVMVSIPLSLAIGIALLNFTGFSINQLSITGFVIALGLLVDDSIVVVENITRFLREGKSRTQAAIEATRQIGVAVLGCTATLLFAFLPLLFLPGTSGLFIRSLPLAVVFTILASLFVSLTIIPFLASLVLKGEEHENFPMRMLKKFIEGSYRKVLTWSIANPMKTILIAVFFFFFSLALIPAIGFSLFPKAGVPQFLITIETPDGSSLRETDKATRFVESVLAEKSKVKMYMTNLGKGNPQIYYNVIPSNQKDNMAEIFASLDKYDAKETEPFIDSLRQTFKTYPNAKINVKEFENGPPLDAPIAIRLIGEDLDTLRTLAARVETLLAETEGTRDIGNPIKITKTDLKVNIDETKAGLFGVPTVEIDKTVRMAIAGLSAGKYRKANGEEYDINVTLPHGQKPTLDALDRTYVSSVTGSQVPLRQVASVAFKASPTLIQHYNRERAVTMKAYVKTGYNTDRVTKTVLVKLATMRFPDGYRFVPAGEIESRQESFGGLGSAIIVAAFGILAVLVLEFKTFKSTLIVASVIPLGIIGGLIMLFIMGYTLSFTAVIGFIALIGIEVKNSILLVDFTNQLREQGVGLDDAIEKAGETRFLPIILTTLTAIGGLLPLAIEGSSLYSPLALVIMGGLISSTILSRLVTPVMYKLLAPQIEVVK